MAKKFEEVALVKLPVEGVVAPIGMPLMDPPVKMALDEVTLVIVAPVAVMVVAWIVGAIRRPRSWRFVPVAFTNMALPMLVSPETYRLVVVVPTNVALLEVRLVLDTVGAERLVIVAFEANRLLEVTLVPEVFTNWKFWR